MARVVQRRGGPPYMLILLAFLFLISTTLAVLFYVRNDEKAKELKGEQTKRSKLSKENKNISADVGELVLKMAGRDLSPEAAIKEADERLERLKLEYKKDCANLSSAIKELSDMVKGLGKEVGNAKSANSELRTRITQKDETIRNIQEGLTKQLNELRKDRDDDRKKFDLAVADKQAQLDRAIAEYKAIIKQKDQRINTLAAELDGRAMKIQQLDARVTQLMHIIRDLKGKEGKVGEWLARKPSGKVVKVFLDQGICYIGLGQKDRITPGLPFSIFSAQTGISKDAKPKAKIVVTNVGPTTSECRFVESNKEDPVIESDLIVNLVFSPTRTYNFVVEGEFDLYGTGRRPDPLAGRRVRAMIERFGGTVADTISVKTDFVIMGEEPPRPPKPAEDAPPAVWRVYNEKMKTYDYYRQVMATAASLQIPVLNTNRFLAFSGYVPKKRLTE